MTDTFVIGIPTLDRPKLLQACLESILRSTVLPKAICIVDNGNYVDKLKLPRAAGVDLDVVKVPYNIGVAASWNTIHRRHAPSDLIISNDDIVFEPDTLARFRAVTPDKYLVFSKIHRSYGGYVFFEPTDRNLEWYAGGYSCFMIREEMFQLVGEYDELLWPGYWEDTDFGKRCEIAQAGRHMSLIEAPFKHGVKHEDIRPIADSVNRSFVGPLAEWNRRRLIMKWGWAEQPPYLNKYKSPYNGETVDELDLFLSKALIDLKIYRECDALAPHLPILKDVASKCRRIVEFGLGRGITTSALLAGKPAQLFSYDKELRMEAYKLMGLRGSTQLEFHKADTTALRIDAADLLFIDTYTNDEQLLKELANQDRVSKYIMVHAPKAAARVLKSPAVLSHAWRRAAVWGKDDASHLTLLERVAGTDGGAAR